MKKAVIWSLMVCGLAQSPQAIGYVPQQDSWLKDALIASAALVGAGYGLYKVCHAYNGYQYEQAVLRLRDHRRMVLEEEQSLSQKVYALTFDDAYFTAYPTEFYEIKARARAYEMTLSRIQKETEGDRDAWSSTDYARDFVADARAFANANNMLLRTVRDYLDVLAQREPLIKLIEWMREETHKEYYAILKAYTSGMFTDRTAQQIYAHSQWPLLEAYQAIERAEKVGRSLFRNACNVCMPRSFIFSQYVREAEQMLAIYAQMKDALVECPAYTRELSRKAQFEQEQERLRLERERVETERRRAEAENRAAEARLRQARALEQQATTNKKAELIRLQERLHEVKRLLNAGLGDRYLRQERDNLQDRINQLKHELDPSRSLLNDVVDVLTDRD